MDNDLYDSFRGLQNYTTLKRGLRPEACGISFRGLQNYTTLKLHQIVIAHGVRFRGLQNYTTLKLPCNQNTMH